jgi:hypothetical protein
LQKEVWTKLTAIEDFAREWFGYDKETKLYSVKKNRMDIYLQCPETMVSIEFAFEPGFSVPAVPDKFWV